MKQLITNYTFSAATKQISLNDYTSVDLSRLLLITNVTDNIIIYNFADPTTGATILGNVITLGYNTTTMSNDDKLQIFYDAAEANAATNEGLEELAEQTILLRRLLKTTEALSTIDVNQRLRVNIDGFAGSALNTTFGLLTRVVDSNGVNISQLNGSTLGFHFALAEIWKQTELARAAYNTGIRANLTFS